MPCLHQLRQHLAYLPALSFKLFLAFALLAKGSTVSLAYTPESPEVIELYEKGLKYLENETDERLGGKCIIGLAFYKAGKPKTHSKIVDAIEACETEVAAQQNFSSIYSKALAVIFLSEIDSNKYRGLIGKYASMMADHQKRHGGYTYLKTLNGDTSQTQYAALAYWELLRTGTRPSVGAIENCANWLLRTQDVTGGWSYQPRDPENYDRVEGTGLTPCMLAAGLSSVLICGNMLGELKAGQAGEQKPPEDELPPELRPANGEQQREVPTLQATGAVVRSRLLKSMADGRRWMDKNFTIDNNGTYSLYYLYSLERYKSFEEYLTGETNPEPEWYNKGYEYLKSAQREDGSWESKGDSEPPCSTAFAILFLLRSTRQSLYQLGEGTLVGGRGLPADLSKAKFTKSGKLIVEQKPTAVDELLGMLGDDDAAALDALIDNPAALVVSDVSPKETRRLEQVVRSGPATARLLAVRALARLRSIDYAPTLIFALTDPDPRVVREARDGLRLVSRKFEGFGMPDNFNTPEKEALKFEAIDKWKTWYSTVRPNVPPLP